MMRQMLLTVLAILACGAKVPDKTPVYELVDVLLDVDEGAIVLGSDVMPVKSKKTDTGICFTGRPGRYAVIVTRTGGGIEAFPTQIVGTGPGPEPPDPDTPPDPPVVPRPAGFAGEVYDQAKGVMFTTEALRAADNAAGIASAIAAGAYNNKTVAQARDDWQKGNAGLLSAKAKPFAAWLSTALSTRVADMKSLQAALEGVAIGLNAVGGKK